MVIYRGERRSDGIQVTVQRSAGAAEIPLRHVRRHSDSFDWGRNNAGALDLARSLLIDAVELKAVELIYRPFAAEVVARLPETGWSLTGTAIREKARDYLSAVLHQAAAVRPAETPADETLATVFGLAKEIQALASETDGGLSIALSVPECTEQAGECVIPWFHQHPEAAGTAAGKAGAPASGSDPLRPSPE